MAFTASFDLTWLDGSNGFVLLGGPLLFLGGRVIAPDLNDDGFDDLLVSASTSNAAFYAIYGKAGGWANVGAATLATGASGFTILAAPAYEGLSETTPAIGDVNGDGFQDVLLAAPSALRNGLANAGEAYLVFGAASPPASALNLAAPLLPAQGMTLTGLTAGSLTGQALALGDLNGDGFDDLIIGARTAGGNTPVKVVFGKAQGLGGAFDLATLNGANGFSIGASGDIGFSLAVADVNGDGLDDLLAGDSFGGTGQAGRVEIVFGSHAAFAATVSVDAPGTAQGTEVFGPAAGDRFGYRVIAAGDFDGDGFGDFTVLNIGGVASSVTLVFGRADWSAGAPRSVRFNGSAGAGLLNGASGDFNGDGYDDMVITSPLADPGGRTDAGIAYVVFGRPGGYSGAFDLASLDGQNGFRVEGTTANASLGASAAGDLNGDGRDELILGAQLIQNLGRAFVVFGQGPNAATGGNDILAGTIAADLFQGLGGNDQIDGLGGADRAGYAAAYSQYDVWSALDGTWRVKDLRAGSPEGADTLISIEGLQFSDRVVKILGLTNAEKLAAAYENILRVSTPTGAEATFLNGLVTAVNGSSKTLAAAITEIVAKADQTTAVAAMSYQFFLNFVPSKGGFDYLVSPQGPNPNNINSAYYQSFNIENRYINFAVNLGKVGEGAPSFLAEYGAKTLFQATKDAYVEIFGGTVVDSKINTILDSSVGSMSRAQYFALYGGDGLTGIGTKAAMVGWLLTEAAKADLGMYANSSNAFLTDLADGAQTLVDVVGVYGKAEYVFNG